MSLIELAERVEKATGPDGGLDSLISYDVVCADWGKHDPRWDTYDWPAFTASLDAAMTLVPEGWAIEDWQIWPGQPSRLRLVEAQIGEDGQYWHSPAKGHVSINAQAGTPALALCAATLRARAHPSQEAQS